MTVRAKTTAASTAGSFAEHERSAPETTLSPRQLASIGLGPASHNVYADRVDQENERGERPLRPYLPLQPADDDEFFDAPLGSMLTVRRDAASTQVERYELVGDYEWRRRGTHDLTGPVISAGQVWAELFSEEDGTMASTVLTPPHGVLYSDRTHYVSRDRIEQPIQKDTVRSVFAKTRGKAQVIARHVYGDRENNISGVRVAAYDEDVTVSVQGGDIVVGGISTHQKFPADTSTAYYREGDIVLRYEPEFGYGWELTLRRPKG
jgi:hypothetical protein